MRKLAALFAALSLLAGAGSAAGAGGGPPQIPRIPGKWSHAEINVTIRKVQHTLIVDRGRIAEITTSQLTIREPDGTMVMVPLTAQTIVNLDNAPATISSLRRRMTVVALRVDGGAAVRVRATSF
jgi:ABC-type Fe3+-hydroxamate transport system substrate-binding protein